MWVSHPDEHIKSVFHDLHSRKVFSLTVALCLVSISLSFHDHAACIPDRICPLFTPIQNSPKPTLPRILAYDRIIPSFTHSQHSAVTLLQPLLTLSIRQSHFGWFCTISAFDGHSLAAFPLSTFSHTGPAPSSRVRSLFAAFAHS